MKKFLSITVLIALLASCGGGYNPPEKPNTNNNESDGRVEAGYATAGFTYETSHPFYVTFNNTSKNAQSYQWDFGDGRKSNEKNPTHKYNGKGVYKVTLTVSGKGHESLSKNITIKEPTTCYVTGIKYDSIPKNNEYYNIRFTDDYLFFETLYWSTDWVLLSSANLPYIYTLKNKQKINFENSEYMMRLYTNTSNSGKGSQVKAWSIKTSDVKKDFSEIRTGTSKNTKVSILLEWED